MSLPLPGEVNPNHPVTQFARENWHKIAALLMQRLGADEVEITIEDVERLSARGVSIVIQDKNERLFVRLIGNAEAERLAREEGGMPA